MSDPAIATGMVRGRFQRGLEDGRVRCELCPRGCELHDGQRGYCYVRECRGDAIWLTSYARASGFCIDPIEKKPLYHFYPGTSVLSFGTAGCNLGCRFCQNWDISKARTADRLNAPASPSDIAETARSWGCHSVAFTYNDPVIFAEFAMDTALACHDLGVRTVAVSAGYITELARKPFFDVMDAANIDLKAITADFYRRICSADIEFVKDTLRYLVRETSVWLELTTLLIPGYNDSTQQVAELSRWVRDELGPTVPLHFTAFHPDYRMGDVPRTPAQTCQAAREVALQKGLEHVYTGNIDDCAGQSTYCFGCTAWLLARRGYDVTLGGLGLGHGGVAQCAACGRPLGGRFESTGIGGFGSRRIAVDVPSAPASSLLPRRSSH